MLCCWLFLLHALHSRLLVPGTMTTTSACTLLVLLVSAAVNVRSWSSPERVSFGGSRRRSRGDATLQRMAAKDSSSSSGNSAAADGDDRERMRTIRALQQTFYSSPDTDEEASPIASPSTIQSDGSIKSLPLWRVSWVELIGRSNVLIVHEARYTHMFEQIIRGAEQQSGQKEMYFGHLRLPGGSASLGKEGYELQAWQREAELLSESRNDDGDDANAAAEAEYCLTDDADQHASCRSAVVGTLMRIVDYRRMGDGKLLLLVQALDRFVVTNPIRELPFSVADVQLLPDSEEIEIHINEDEESFPGDKSGWYAILGDEEAARLRSKAAAEAKKWQNYEFDSTIRLPVRDDGKDDLSAADVVGTALKGVIPHVPFSSAVTPSELMFTAEDLAVDVLENSKPTSAGPLLEKQLVDSGILLGRTKPDPRRRRSFFLAEELEIELWKFVNEWVQIHNATSKFPPELLALLPRNIDWPDGFVLEDLAATMAAASELKGARLFVRVSDDYPAHRRRRRLSYVISALTDHTPFGKGMPAILLEIHSTRDRLEAVIDVFEFVNTEHMGEFS